MQRLGCGAGRLGFQEGRFGFRVFGFGDICFFMSWGLVRVEVFGSTEGLGA